MTESNMIRRYIIEFDDEGKAINLHRIYPKKGPERALSEDRGDEQLAREICESYEWEIAKEATIEHASGHKSHD